MTAITITAPHAHAILAACLADPGLINRWQCGSRAELLAAGVDLHQFDVDALRRFAGFITKVRHNPLRGDFPLTFAVLAASGLEIEAFADYASAFAALARAGRLSPDARVNAFVEFLCGWLDADSPRHLLGRDIVRHEAAIWRLRQLAASGPLPAMALSRLPAVDAIPVVRGALRVQSSAFDPRRIARRLIRRDADFDRMQPGCFFFGYWWNGQAPDVQVIELNAAAACVLAAIDGRRTIDGIAAHLALAADAKVEPHDLSDALQEAAEAGLLVFRAARRGGRNRRNGTPDTKLRHARGAGAKAPSRR